MLLSHHLWAFPEKLPGVITGITDFIQTNSLFIIGDFCKMCVAIFMFLSGYGKSIKYSNKKPNTFIDIKKMYFQYWKVFLIFVPLGFVFFGNQLPYCQNAEVYSVFSRLSISELVLNFIGLLSTYNHEWWFITTYVICVCLFPFIKRMAEHLSVYLYVLLVLCFQFVFLILERYKLFEYCDITRINIRFLAPYVVCFCAGVLFAVKGLFSRFAKEINKIRFKHIFCCFIIIVVFVLRESIHQLALDSVFVILLIFALKNLLIFDSVVKKALAFLGKYSAYMWLIHSFFCYYYGPVAQSVVFFRWAIPSLIVLTIYSLLSSILVDGLWKLVLKGLSTLLRAINNGLHDNQIKG